MTEDNLFDFDAYSKWVKIRSTGNGAHFVPGDNYATTPSVEFPKIADAVREYEALFPAHKTELTAHRRSHPELYRQLAELLLAPGKHVREVYRKNTRPEAPENPGDEEEGRSPTKPGFSGRLKFRSGRDDGDFSNSLY